MGRNTARNRLWNMAYEGGVRREMWILLKRNPDGEEYCVGRIMRGVQLKRKGDGEEYCKKGIMEYGVRGRSTAENVEEP